MSVPIIVFLPINSSKTVSLRCSFCFHVDSNRATAHANNERRLPASRYIRSIRIAITVPCQWHQEESLVMPLSLNCQKKGSRYDAIKLFLRRQRQYYFLGIVIRNASFAQLQNCLVTMALYKFNGATVSYTHLTLPTTPYV